MSQQDYVLVKRGIDILNIILAYSKDAKNRSEIFQQKRPVAQIFFQDEAPDRLRHIFFEQLPIEKLSKYTRLLNFLSTMTSMDGGTKYSSPTNRDYKIVDFENDLQELIDLFSAELSVRDGQTVFYSWQSESKGSDNRSYIEESLKIAIRSFNEKHSEIRLTLDQDTRGVAGSPDIVNAILKKSMALLHLLQMSRSWQIVKSNKMRDASTLTLMYYLN